MWCLSIRLSTCISIYSPIHPSIYSSIRPSIHPSIKPSIYLSIYLSIHLSIITAISSKNMFITQRIIYQKYGSTTILFHDDNNAFLYMQHHALQAIMLLSMHDLAMVHLLKGRIPNHTKWRYFRFRLCSSYIIIYLLLFLCFEVNPN